MINNTKKELFIDELSETSDDFGGDSDLPCSCDEKEEECGCDLNRPMTEGEAEIARRLDKYFEEEDLNTKE